MRSLKVAAWIVLVGMVAVLPTVQAKTNYAYVANNPLSKVDPSGLLMIPACAFDNTCSGGGGGGSVVGIRSRARSHGAR
jgi:hypothetical protein